MLVVVREDKHENENEDEHDWGIEEGAAYPGFALYQVYSINSNATANATAAAESTLRLNLLIRLS